MRRLYRVVNMKTLYISDLDGTLLNSETVVSEYTVRVLNTLIEKGLCFSSATARTLASVEYILKNVKINIPIILMNGVAIYDMKNKKYTRIFGINRNGVNTLLRVIKKHINMGFLYCIDDDILSTYYENTDSPAAAAFVEERQRKYNKKFTKVDSFTQCTDKNIVFYSVDGKKEELDAAYGELIKCKDLHIEYYRDMYNEGHWYLEASAAEASKKQAVLSLKEQLGFDKIVSFGDNLNDIPMFEASDECYAVENAMNEVKEKATAVIASNLDNGVADFLLKNFS